ncbi:MAG: hypothetical protein [Phormidium phage MIS-PhV1A]|uniref:hypothetical protein n=1 Tax=Phormidium phage MIS-PhV1A TaxID=1391455 RepID=UPI0003C9E3EB|nr:MAG: hypothetical protein AV945_gp28 [Phormidium phage MIS-PhV1A]AGZ61773.1 MAG: hypothetical protein [Phormidium phage MIS-PhV1A]
MSYVTQLRTRQAQEKARLIQSQKELKVSVATMVSSAKAQRTREKKSLADAHKSRLAGIKDKSDRAIAKNNYASQKSAMVARHKRETEQWASYKKVQAQGWRVDKENLAAKHKNDLAYAIKAEKAKPKPKK